MTEGKLERGDSREITGGGKGGLESVSNVQCLRRGAGVNRAGGRDCGATLIKSNCD